MNDFLAVYSQGLWRNEEWHPFTRLLHWSRVMKKMRFIPAAATLRGSLCMTCHVSNGAASLTIPSLLIFLSYPVTKLGQLT